MESDPHTWCGAAENDFAGYSLAHRNRQIPHFHNITNREHSSHKVPAGRFKANGHRRRWAV